MDKYSICVIIQLNGECSVWAGKQSWNGLILRSSYPHATSCTQLSLLGLPYQHSERQRQPCFRWEAYRRLRSISFHFFTCERHRSGGDGSAFPCPHRAYYTWTQGEYAGLSQRFSSLLVSPPPRDPLQAMWVGQTDFLTQGFIWGNRKKGTGLSLT